MAVTIKNIAQVAGVSYSTVSRALSDSPRVSSDTKELVQRIAAEMGYLPSAIGRGLVLQRTNTVGVVVPTLTDLFFAEVVSAIEETAIESHYGLILVNSRGERNSELKAIRALRERRVDGIIVVSGYSRRQDLGPHAEIDIPIVVLNNVHQEHIGCSVEMDNLCGGKLVTRHLLDLGHRRIAYIAGPPTEWDSVERQMGYTHALRQAGLAPDPALVVTGDSRPGGGATAMQQLLSLPDPPTAVFCYNDATALGVMRAIRAAGRSVPGDVSVAGFDDINRASHFEPPLTTIAQPIEQMADTAFEMVLALVAGAECLESCVLPGTLVVRSSTGPAPIRGLGDRPASTEV